MRRPTIRRPRIADDVARYNLVVGLLALVAALLLVALVAPGAINLGPPVELERKTRISENV